MEDPLFVRTVIGYIPERFGILLIKKNKKNQVFHGEIETEINTLPLSTKPRRRLFQKKEKKAMVVA